MCTRQFPSFYFIYCAFPSHTQFRHQHEPGVFSYTFLDACTPLLVVEKGNRIAFTTRSPSQPGGANSNSKAKYLMFPNLSDDVEYSGTMVFHDSKLPQPESYLPTSMSFLRATVPANTDHGVVALSIFTIKRDEVAVEDDVHAYHLAFFLRETLARLFQQGQECSLEAEGEGEASYNVDWADWGPKASRWFGEPESSFGLWRCSVHGYRFVTLVKSHEALNISSSFRHAKLKIKKDDHLPYVPSTLHLLVFDFNPYPLRRHQYSPATDNSYPSSNGISNGYTIAIAPSGITFWDREELFDRGIVNQLACRVTLMEEPADYNALAVCKDNIIGIKVRPKENIGVAELS